MQSVSAVGQELSRELTNSIMFTLFMREIVKAQPPGSRATGILDLLFTNNRFKGNNPLGINSELFRQLFTSTWAARDSRESGKQQKSTRKLWKCNEERENLASTLLFGVSRSNCAWHGKVLFWFFFSAWMKNSVKNVLSHRQSCFFSLILQVDERKRVNFCFVEISLSKSWNFVKIREIHSSAGFYFV